MFSWTSKRFMGLIFCLSDETSVTHAKRRRDLYSHCHFQGEEWEQEWEEEEELRIACDSIMDITGWDWTRQDRTSI
jgi:hypothetical protein